MARSGIVKTNVSGSIAFADGTGTPVTLTASFDRGDFVLSDAKEVLNEDVAIERRGRYINSAHGARVYPQVSFSCWADAFVGVTSAPGTELGYLMRSGQYTANVSTLGSGTSVPYAINITITIEGTDFGDSADATITLHDVQVSSFSFTEASEGNSLSFTGIVRGEVDGDLALDEVA